MVIRVLLIDDHPLLRDGVAALLEGQPDMLLVGQAANGKEGVALFFQHCPDVTLMDLQMPDLSGIDAIAAIREKSPDARIIVLTTYSGDVQAVRALKAGASAYLVKSVLHKELLHTIRSVHAGRKEVSPAVAAEIATHFGEDALTPREVEVLQLIASGYANKQIAASLFITEETVKSRVKNILAKLSARDRTHAAVIGAKRGIIKI